MRHVSTSYLAMLEEKDEQYAILETALRSYGYKVKLKTYICSCTGSTKVMTLPSINKFC